MRKADNLTTFMCWSTLKSESLNLLETSGPVQACNVIDLTFNLDFMYEQTFFQVVGTIPEPLLAHM